MISPPSCQPPAHGYTLTAQILMKSGSKNQVQPQGKVSVANKICVENEGKFRRDEVGQDCARDLSTNDHCKYLDVTLQSNLKFDIHVQEIVAKANCTLGLIRRIVKTTSLQLKERAYKALVCPQLEYACTVWSPMPVLSGHLCLYCLVTMARLSH